MSTARPYHREARRAILLAIGGLLAIVLGLTLLLPSSAAPQRAPYQATAYPGGLIQVANSCGPTFRFGIRADQYGIIPDAVYKRYPNGKLAVPVAQMIVPVYGYLDRRGLTRDKIRFYSQEEDPAYPSWVVLRAMYDYDTLVIWYTGASTPEDQAVLARFAAERGNVLVLPWPTDNRTLPSNRAFAFARWGMSQTCQTLDPQLPVDFDRFTRAHPVQHALNAPQVATELAGVLPSINARETGELNYEG